MTVAACPAASTLAAFARGDLPPAEISAVAGHVGGCAACAAALQLVPEGSLAELARAAAGGHTVLSVAPPMNQPVLPVASDIPTELANHPRYRILSQLGAGGMGTVYKAEDTFMGRTVALKVVSAHLTAKASAVGRFHKEVRAAAQLSHQNIVTAYDTGEAAGNHYLVMEFVEGVSLDRLVAKKGPLAVSLAVQFARQAALGLQHAADKKLVHRDIKPHNLMVTRKGQVKILDFGLARFASTGDEADETAAEKMPFGAGKQPTDAGVTNPHLLMGTPDYLSPEQAKNSHDVDARSDIYSLGCTLYFLLTGRPPFLQAETLIDKLLAHTQEEPVPVWSVRPEVPAGLAEVLAKMMAKKPDDRYQSAGEVAAALTPFTKSDAAKEPQFEIVEAVIVTPVPAAAPLVRPSKQFEFDTAPVGGSATLGDAPRPKRAKKKKKRAGWWARRKWQVVGLVTLLAVAGIALAASNRGKEPPVDPGATTKGDPPVAPDPSTGPVIRPDASGLAFVVSAARELPKSGQPTVISPTRTGTTVLYVLPSKGMWLDDYTRVRARLEANRVKVVTTSTDGGKAETHQNRPGAAVPIDVLLSEAVRKLSEYDAVIFAGMWIDEYIGTGRGARDAKAVIEGMKQSGKPVAAICIGQGVLAGHGYLKGKRAAHCKPLADFYPTLGGSDSGTIRDKGGVVVDGQIVTASGGFESEQFADAVLAAIKK